MFCHEGVCVCARVFLVWEVQCHSCKVHGCSHPNGLLRSHQLHNVGVVPKVQKNFKRPAL